MTDSKRQRVLRWVFVRGGERQTCELALNERALLYEFSIVLSWIVFRKRQRADSALHDDGVPA